MKTASGSPSGEMCIMDASGHQRLKWHMGNLDEIGTVRASFDRLLTEGYTAFASSKKAAAKHAVTAFDPSMEEVIMVPRIVGG